MKMRLSQLLCRTRRSTERFDFSGITFLHGRVGTGKSSVARLVDYCLGGTLERTPALQQEFVSAELAVRLGEFDCLLERGADDSQSVRVSWSDDDGNLESVSAPLAAQTLPLIEAEVFNLSDLLFYLCGVEPIKVRQRRADPQSRLVRLSFRDIWRYCYIDQAHMDSSFYRLEDSHRGRKSQDAMRFFTGLHSERLSQLEKDYYSLIDEQRSKRDAVVQIQLFMERFDLGSESELLERLAARGKTASSGLVGAG